MSILETMHEGIETVPVFRHAATGEPKWFAIQTRARHEKKVDAQLHGKGIEAFLPLASAMHKWCDRQRMVHQPLFSGYVFVHIPDSVQLRKSVLTTSGVCWFVGNQGMGLPIPEKQIQDIRTILASSASYSPYPFVCGGSRARIVGGSLNGIEGVLVTKGDERSVVVSVDVVRRSLAVRVDGQELEPA